MWRAPLVFYQLLALARPLAAQGDAAGAAVTPRSCSLDCVRQGRAGCEYCRITREDMKKALGLNSINAFGSCVPRPCFELLGKDDAELCQHYVQAPNEVTVEFLHEPNPDSDAIVVSWRPSHYGIAFLRGFQVSLQALGGSAVACQLFLFHTNISLTPSHAHRMYKSDPFPGLSLGSQYAVTVMALPVPEQWERFYQSKIFSTRSCAEKNGLDRCKKDWFPKHVAVTQEGAAVTVTFNLAPPNLGIRSYFSLCYAHGTKKYTDIRPTSSENKTYHSYEMKDLQQGTNYTCEIAANEVDAVRKLFSVYVERVHTDASQLSVTPSLALMLPLFLVMAIMLTVILAVLTKRRPSLHIKPDIIKQHQAKETAEEVVSLPGHRPTPPRLLICYSGRDGPAHVDAVMQLGAFIQQHMATQVRLDLWDSLGVAEEGSVAWHCRHIRESDFVLVICSWGLRRGPELPEPYGSDEDEEEIRGMKFGTDAFGSDAVVRLIVEDVCWARSRGQDLSKYMAAVFECSGETDIPAELGLVSHYVLPSDLALLFSHLHGVPLHRPGAYLKIKHISEEGFKRLPAGAALQRAIDEAGAAVRAKVLHSVQGGDSELTAY